MTVSGGRKGFEFEQYTRKLLAKYGFYIVSENEEIPCQNNTEHKKHSHEVDIIVSHNLKEIPYPPLTYAQNSFAISCKGGKSLEEKDILDAQNQFECVQMYPPYREVKNGLIICQSASDSLIRKYKGTNIWESSYMHLISEKMKIARVFKYFAQHSEIQFRNIGSSVLIGISITNQQETMLNLSIFNEQRDHDIGKSELLEALTNVFTSKEYSRFNRYRKNVSVFSAAGIRSDLLSLKGNFLPEIFSTWIHSLIDLSIATWAPYAEDNYL